jgi:hypothetical protein
MTRLIMTLFLALAALGAAAVTSGSTGSVDMRRAGCGGLSLSALSKNSRSGRRKYG